MEKHNSCVNSRAIIQYVAVLNPERVGELLEDLGPELAGIEDPRAFLSDPNNWISSTLLIELFARAKKISGDDQVAFKIGYDSVLKQHLGYIQRILLQAFGTPGRILRHLQKVNDHFNRTKEINLLEIGRGRALVRLTWTKDIALDRDFCLMNKGVYSAVPVALGLPPGRVLETGCFFEGADCCEYDLRWESKSVIKNLFHRFFAPWKVMWATIDELERDKEILREQYQKVHQLNLTLQHKVDQLLSLQKTSTAILSTLDLDELLDLILKSLLKVAFLDRAGIFLAGQGKDSLTLIHAVGIPAAMLKEFKGYRIPMSKKDNIIARAAGHGKPMFIEDVTKIPLNPENPFLQRFQPKAFILVPLTVRGQVVGILVGDRRSDQSFIREIDKEFLTSFANHIAMAIENTSLYRQLEDSERKYREIVENVHEGIWILEAGGTVSFGNRRLAELLGYNDLVGRDVYTFVHARSKKTFLKILRQNLEGRAAKEEVELVLQGGGSIRVLLSSVPIFAGQEYTGSLALVTDLTEKKRMEDRLLQAQKLESVGTMAGGIAHDFNNILTGIIGYSQLLRNTVASRPESTRFVDIILQSSFRAAELVRQLLAFSRGGDSGEEVAAPVNEIVLDTMELLKSSLPKNIEVETSLGHNLPSIRCNPTQLQQVILNICVNARDAMPEGGTLKVSTSLAELSGECLGRPDRDVEPGPCIRITIEDTGVGITSEVKERLFDPFFTTKEVGKGTGLGLAMVYGIVKNAGGCIFVESTPGSGTTFELYFPVAGTTGQARPLLAQGQGRPLSGTETILVVDDEEIVRDLAVDILSSAGYHVLTAADGIEALHTYKVFGSTIHLVVLDLVMPRMDGNKVFHEIRKLNPGVRILLCTGYCPVEDLPPELIEPAEITAVTCKPFKVDDLLTKVRGILD